MEAALPVVPIRPVAVNVNDFFALNLPSMSVTELLLELYCAALTGTTVGRDRFVMPA